MRSRNRVDANTKAVREACQRAGAVWIDVSSSGTGFDAVIAYRGGLWLVEVKDGAKVASRRELTDTERKRMEQLTRVGVMLHVVLNETEALRLIGAIR